MPSKIKNGEVNMTFEEQVKRLGEIVQELENNNPTLDEVNKLFNEGVKLTKDCYKTLNETKGKITILQEEINGLIEKPFD